MQLSIHIILSFWMLLATMPFSISMHYCKGIEADLCVAGVTCCSSSKSDLKEKTTANLCCSTDCCSELSITSIPTEQFKNNSKKEFQQLNYFSGLLFNPASYKKQQSFFLQKIKKRPPLPVNKAFAVNQSFLC